MPVDAAMKPGTVESRVWGVYIGGGSQQMAQLNRWLRRKAGGPTELKSANGDWLKLQAAHYLRIADGDRTA